MEFYLHNKDDRKSSTLVNLATTFKLNDINYIVYYNTEVEKSVIDIYIGKISYGDQCLVINKIDSDKQSEFLNIIKSILASNAPETEFSDYENIIDTATIVLESVQKIQIPTNSLDILKKYHNKEVEVESEKIQEETTDDFETENDNSDINIETTNELDTINEQSEPKENNENLEDKEDIKTSDNQTTIDNQTAPNSDNFINSNDKLSSLDNMLEDRNKKAKEPKKKMVSTPIIVLFVIVIIISIILYFFGESLS